ncbi:MAG: hypothetical protein R3A48_02435 [Polyangiales bacterium]
MKSSTLMALSALLLAVSAGAHVGAADPTPESLRRATVTRLRLPAPRAASVERVLTAERVTQKEPASAERQSDHHYRVTLPAGCSRLVAVGDGSVRDLAFEVRGPRTMRMRQDAARGAIEAVSVCGAGEASYEVVVSAKGAQAIPSLELRVRSPG